MDNSLVLACEIPAPPESVYRAWIDAHEHCLTTYGGHCESDPRPHGEFSWGDGYETGVFLVLEENRRILQSWRTTDFPLDAGDSLVEITLSALGEGCLLILRQTNLPDGDTDDYIQGWEKYYFEPMKRFFKERTLDEPLTSG